MRKKYNHIFSCRELDKPDYYLVQSDYELREVLEYIGLPKRYREDITGVILIIYDADYDAVWLSESGRYFDLSATYYALPFYRPNHWRVKNLPIYWKKENPYYKK